MATYTDNYNLIKPDYNNDADINDLNSNFDVIDNQMKIMSDNIDTAVTELANIIDNSSKNLFNMSASSGNIAGGGITVTVNTDKSLTLNGTSQNSGVTNFHTGKLSLPAGKYVLSGCTGGSNSTYFLRIISTPVITNIDGSVEFETTGLDDVYIDIVIGGYKTLDNITFRPMVCSKIAWELSTKYIPYRPNYQELYERIIALEQANGITRNIISITESTEETYDR